MKLARRFIPLVAVVCLSLPIYAQDPCSKGLGALGSGLSVDRLKKKMKQFSGKHTLTNEQLFPDGFIAEYTPYPSFKALTEAAGIQDIEEVRGEAFSKFVAEHTSFESFDDMLKKGYVEHVKRTVAS